MIERIESQKSFSVGKNKSVSWEVRTKRVAVESKLNAGALPFSPILTEQKIQDMQKQNQQQSDHDMVQSTLSSSAATAGNSDSNSNSNVHSNSSNNNSNHNISGGNIISNNGHSSSIVLGGGGSHNEKNLSKNAVVGIIKN